ncbi:hypothetical protein DIPPA_26129 [Diplonema papillatum]|nr:hypothetical protein DIPPA_26129 [Diplonema papillatum]
MLSRTVRLRASFSEASRHRFVAAARAEALAAVRSDCMRALRQALLPRFAAELRPLQAEQAQQRRDLQRKSQRCERAFCRAHRQKLRRLRERAFGPRSVLGLLKERFVGLTAKEYQLLLENQSPAQLRRLEVEAAKNRVAAAAHCPASSPSWYELYLKDVDERIAGGDAVPRLALPNVPDDLRKKFVTLVPTLASQS